MEDKDFSLSNDLAPLPHSLPSLPSLYSPLAHWKTQIERQVADGREGKEVGEEPNHATETKPDPLQIIQYSLFLPHQ
jgi:hypothetical protein